MEKQDQSHDQRKGMEEMDDGRVPRICPVDSYCFYHQRTEVQAKAKAGSQDLKKYIISL